MTGMNANANRDIFTFIVNMATMYTRIRNVVLSNSTICSAINVRTTSTSEVHR